MKRSQLNEALQLAIDFFAAHRIYLPKWAFWPAANWEHVGPEATEIRECRLGWDIRDRRLGNFEHQGLVVFNLRGGRPIRKFRKPFAERLFLLERQKSSPARAYRTRITDLDNRGGGDVEVQLHNALQDGSIDESERVGVSINGIVYNLRPGGIVKLSPGDSLAMPAMVYHRIWADTASCVLGEVSTNVDEATDLFYASGADEYPESIEENAPPLHLLCDEYPEFD